MTELERQKISFEEILKIDRYDQTTHFVFADWLSEHGFDELAEHHRTWTETRQKMEDGREWIAAFAERIGVTFQQAMEMGNSYVEADGEQYFSLITEYDNPKIRDEDEQEYWKHWQMAIGVVINLAGRGIFDCSC